MNTIKIEIAIAKEQCGVSEFESLITALNFSFDELVGYIDENEELQMRRGLIGELKTLESLKRSIWDAFFKSMTQKHLSDTPQKP